MKTIGNLSHTPYKYHVYIYDGKTVQPKIGLTMPDDTVDVAETMGEHYVQFSFNSNEPIPLRRVDYVKRDGIYYRLRFDCQPKEVNTQCYTYEPKFEAPEMFFQDCVMFYTMRGYKESEWVLFGNASQFFAIAADNICKYLLEEWKVGIIEPDEFELQNISFNGNNVFDALTQIAEAFGCEWYVDYALRTINLVRQRATADIVTLQREVQLIDINQAKESADNYCTRLFALGSTRNIPKKYRPVSDEAVIDAIAPKMLRLPVGVGDYIDAFPDLEYLDIVEHVQVFDDIYPKRIGTITAMRTVEKKDDEGNPFVIYYFKDAGLKFKTDYILPSETLMLQFGNNSWLNGRDFELKYNDKSQEFEIINITEGDNYLPNELLKPKVGDEYVLYGFDITMVGDEYIPLAEKELEKAAREYLEKASSDTATYTCTVNPVYRKKNELDLPLGQSVRLKSVLFTNGEKAARVFGYRKYPVTGKDEYVCGDVMDYKRLARMENKTEENKKIADVQYLEALKLAGGTAKNLKAISYIRQALENETMIDKGLLLTTLLRLGAVEGSEWKEKAGINGAATNADEVVAYFGGSLDAAVEGATPIGFKVDGSGWLANQNILWDALGNLLMSGKFESNKDGNRIIIDPKDRSLKMLNVNGQELFSLSFEVFEFNDKELSIPKLVISLWDGDERIYWTEMIGSEISIYNNSGDKAYIGTGGVGILNTKNDTYGFSASKNWDGSLIMSMRGLPTSANKGVGDRLYTTSINGHNVLCT